MDIAIFGAGNGAHALACDLSLRGQNVTLWENPEFAQNIRHLQINGNKIRVSGAISGEAHIAQVTTDARLALSNAEIAFVIMPSFGQESTFDYMVPHLREGQVVFVMPGNFGSLSLYSKLKKRGLEDKVIIGESDTIPYATRLNNDKSCNIFGVKESMWASSVPYRNTKKMVEKLDGILPVKLITLQSVIAVALANTNMIIHCPTMIMNAGRIETGPRFRFYNDGMSQSVCQVMEKMDDERLRVASALGYSLVTEFEDAIANYSLDPAKYKNLHDIFSSHPVYSKMGADSPQDIAHRYLTEDVPFLLVPLSKIGRMLNIPTPTIDAIIHLAGVVNKTDYMTCGRGLDSMGFKGLPINDIKIIVNS